MGRGQNLVMLVGAGDSQKVHRSVERVEVGKLKNYAAL